jgi:hypothetical protein
MSDAYLAARAARDQLRASADFRGGNVIAVAVRSEANALRKQHESIAAAAAAATMRPVSPAPPTTKVVDRSKFTVPAGFVYPAKRSVVDVRFRRGI